MILWSLLVMTVCEHCVQAMHLIRHILVYLADHHSPKDLLIAKILQFPLFA